jgi:hypothetical protein
MRRADVVVGVTLAVNLGLLIANGVSLFNNKFSSAKLQGLIDQEEGLIAGTRKDQAETQGALADVITLRARWRDQFCRLVHAGVTIWVDGESDGLADCKGWRKL